MLQENFSHYEPKSSIKVIVIDDHELVRMGLIQLIESEKGMEVIGDFSDIESFLRYEDCMEPDVVLSDISLPSGPPFEALKLFRKNHPNCKIVFLTAFSSDSNLELALRSGCSAFVSKKDPLEDVTSAIKEVNANKNYYSKSVESRIVPHPLKGQEQHLTVRRELLSSREIQVLCSVSRGLSAKSIGFKLGISPKTVERHKSNIMEKLGLHTCVDLARYSIKEGLVSVNES